MVSLLLAALIAQTKGIKCYDLQTSEACRGERVSLVRRPDSVYDVNCLDVRLARGPFSGVGAVSSLCLLTVTERVFEI